MTCTYERMVIMKYLMRILPAVLLGFCFYQSAGAAQTAGSAASAGGAGTDVIARVDGQPLYGRELETVIRRELSNIDNPEWSSLRADYRARLIYDGVLSLINSRLLYEKAVASGDKATDAEIDAYMQAATKGFANDAEMNVALARLFLDRDSFKKNLGVDITVNKFLASLAKPITVEPEEITKYYAENPEKFAHPDIVRVSHIMLASDEKSELDADTKERAESILARAKKGEDFAKLAKEYSVDDSASTGGDLGYVTKEVLDPVFANAVFSMSLGEIRLVKTSFGYHVVKLTEKKPEGVAPLDDAREFIINSIKSEKAEKELLNVMKKLQQEAKIEIFISADDWRPRGSSTGTSK